MSSKFIERSIFMELIDKYFIIYDMILKFSLLEL